MIPSTNPLIFKDELAATSYYEAALYEDPAVDVEDYFSDWEYYSDDYWDDDPSVKQTSDTSAATKPCRGQAAPRTNNRIPRPQPPVKPDISSFQGVIWKSASLERDQDIAVQIYEPGHGDKVALFENWREIFKSAQPALDKSRLRKRKTREVPMEDVSFADDEFPCDDDDQRRDSSDDMSDVLSGDDKTESGDAGDASNTTPEFVPPKDAPRSTVVVPTKRGRKRKAEVPPEEGNKDNPDDGSTKTRAKRVASKKSDGEASVRSTSSGPVRRSARQKK